MDRGSFFASASMAYGLGISLAAAIDNQNWYATGAVLLATLIWLGWMLERYHEK